MPAGMLDPPDPMSTMCHPLHAALWTVGQIAPIAPNPAPTTLPTAATPTVVAANLVILALLFALLVGGVFTFVKTQPWKPRSVLGPERLAAGQSVGWLWGKFVIAVLAFFGVQIAYLTFIGFRSHHADKSAALGGAALLVVSLGSQVAAFATLLALNGLDPARPLRRLGMSAANVLPGLKVAAVSLVAILPIVYVATLVNAAARYGLGLPNDVEHPMIELLGKNDSVAMIAFTLLAASIFAPLLEELLFRGHLQTAIAYTASRLFRRREPEPVAIEPYATAPSIPPPPPVPPFLNYQSASVLPPVVGPGIGSRWAGILLASAVFALVHPPFSIPVVFVLAICLGYVYERTGNLWATIFIHCAFNSIQLALFLLLLTLGIKQG